MCIRDRQKQKFYELFPETPDKPEIEGYEVIEFRKVKIGEQYVGIGGSIYKRSHDTDTPRWVVKPIKEEDTYWQDLYGECVSHAIKVEGDKDEWAKLYREDAIKLADKDRRIEYHCQDISKLKRSHAEKIEEIKRQHNQEISKLQGSVDKLTDSLGASKFQYSYVVGQNQIALTQIDELHVELTTAQDANKKLKEELAAAKENIFKKMWRNVV